ncbi:MAG: Cytochrome c-type biogenesis protein CcmH [Alphaproteobacteria bacterium MarineAlpha2_Bin1]|nr:MAG: Cytochrome c-type biogenesis protein CcmH [Alphaproteobacteria bacterium MarineAlpha2_Bin1]
MFNFIDIKVYSDDKLIDSEVLEERSQKIFKEIRCLVCQNQSIEDSSAGLAKQIKSIVKGLIQEGYSDSDVRNYLVDRYGNWILLKPPFNLSTAALWLLPFTILFLAILTGLFYILKKNKIQKNKPVLPLEQDEQQKLNKILDDF